MIKRRAAADGLCRPELLPTFWGEGGSPRYLSNGGTLAHAQQIAGRRWGEEVVSEMSEAVLRAAREPAATALMSSAAVVLPRLIVDAGHAAVQRFSGVPRGSDREREDVAGVRAGGGPALSRGGARPAAWAWAMSRRSTWPPTSGPHRESVPTVRQHVAATRMLSDW